MWVALFGLPKIESWMCGGRKECYSADWSEEMLVGRTGNKG